MVLLLLNIVDEHGFTMTSHFFAFSRWCIPKRRYILSVNQFMHSQANKLMILLCCGNFKVLSGAALFNFTHSKERAGAISGLKYLTLRAHL